VARQDVDRTASCEACKAHELEETIDHIFQCPSRQRRELLVSELDAMVAQFKKWKTADCITDALYTGVRSWIEGKDIPPAAGLDLPDTELGRLTAIAYTEQTHLGWSSFLRGFRATSWRKAQDVEYRNLLPGIRGQQDNGENWSGQTTLWFIHLFEKVWIQRNGTQHGVTPEDILRQRTALADLAIRRLYQAGETLSDAERQPFRHSLSTMLAKPFAIKESWVQQTDRKMPSARWRDKKRAKKKWPAITSHFLFQDRDGPT
jgi:uncharacterized membrane protein